MKTLFIFTLSLCILFCLNCKSQLQSDYIAVKQSYEKAIDNCELLDHLPKSIDNSEFIDRNMILLNNDNKHNGNYGEILISIKSSKKEIDQIKSRKFKYVINYSSNNFYIVDEKIIKDTTKNLDSNLRKLLHDSIAPIANIREVDYLLGNKNDSYNYNYIIPNDCVIYVIEAKNGCFWKEGCISKRSDIYGKWKNGFSRGYAISENSGIVTYWMIIW